MRYRRYMPTAIVTTAVVCVAAATLLLFAHTQIGDTKLTVRWDFDYAGTVPCRDGLKINCIKGFNVFGGNPREREWQVFVPNQFDDAGQLIKKDIATTVTTAHRGTVCVATVATDKFALSIESTPACSPSTTLGGIGRP